jgi:hypothetical protein
LTEDRHRLKDRCHRSSEENKNETLYISNRNMKRHNLSEHEIPGSRGGGSEDYVVDMA